MTDTGGNAGSQSSTLIIRGMAVGEIQTRDILKVIWKELRVGIISLFATVLLAKTVGGTLPIVAKLLHLDPTIMAAPLITTIVDAFSLVIYFQLDCSLLQLG